jgi:hypothetical protein
MRNAIRNTKPAVNFCVHKIGGRSSTGIPEILDREVGIAEISMSCHHGQIPRGSIFSATSIKSSQGHFRTLPDTHRQAWGKSLSGPLL